MITLFAPLRAGFSQMTSHLFNKVLARVWKKTCRDNSSFLSAYRLRSHVKPNNEGRRPQNICLYAYEYLVW